MNSFEIAFTNPWLLLLMIPAAVIIIFAFIKGSTKKKGIKKILPLIIHLVVAALLTLIISGIFFVSRGDTQSVVLLLDMSDSAENVRSEIINYANDFIDETDSETDTEVMIFAGNAISKVDLNNNKRHVSENDVSDRKVISYATDIESALKAAFSDLPADTNKRIILISDGRETQGDADSYASSLAKLSVRLDTVYVGTSYLSNPEIQISGFEVTDSAYEGEELNAAVTLQSNLQQDVTVVLYDNEVQIASTELTVGNGSKNTNFKITAAGEGQHSLMVEVEPASDTLDENNRMYGSLTVYEKPDVLLVSSDTEKTEVLEAIIGEENNVTLISAGSVPLTLAELCKYDEVFLSNVNASDLPEEFGNILNTYVYELGGSLVMSGGSNTYMYGNMQDTIYEEMLPVTLALTESVDGESVALMLVLDCSMSMSMSNLYLSLAKQGAIQCLNAVSTSDSIGVVSFNSDAYLDSPLIKATEVNKDSLTRIISGLETSQGTYYSAALNVACSQLANAENDKKHVIFLSDGNPNSDNTYNEWVTYMHDIGITVSTIALGYDSTILEEMAELGGGRYYAVTTVDDLPDIMLSEAEQATVSSYIQGTFTPVIVTGSTLTEGLGTDLPSLDAYLGTMLKKNAECLLATDTGNPIFSRWQYGLGTVGSFASDLEGEWSESFIESETGKALVNRMIESTLPETHNKSSIRMSLTNDGLETELDVTLPEQAEEMSVQAVIATASSENMDIEQTGKWKKNNATGYYTCEYSLRDAGEGLYTTKLSTPSEGLYAVNIVYRDENGDVVDSLEKYFSVSYTEEYDAFSMDGSALMASLSNHSDGLFLTALADESDDERSRNVQDLKNIEMDVVESIKNPLVPLAIAICILMLADIAIRLIRKKDLKRFFLRQ